MGSKTLPTIWGTYMKLVTKYQISAINSCWEKCDEKCAYSIFLSNYWLQESDIWSQASYRYAILWEAFLDPSDSYFLFADLVGFYTTLISSAFRGVNFNKMNCELMLTYDTPALWQTGSRNLTGQKTLPTIWGTYIIFSDPISQHVRVEICNRKRKIFSQIIRQCQHYCYYAEFHWFYTQRCIKNWSKITEQCCCTAWYSHMTFIKYWIAMFKRTFDLSFLIVYYTMMVNVNI
jgi:hypothetical protein